MGSKPAQNASLESLIRFVQDKYIRKLYVPECGIEPKQHYQLTRKYHSCQYLP